MRNQSFLCLNMNVKINLNLKGEATIQQGQAQLTYLPLDNGKKEIVGRDESIFLCLSRGSEIVLYTTMSTSILL